MLLAASTALAVGQRLRLVPKRIDPGRVPVRRGALPDPTGDDVWLFTGCVMDAWLRDTHRSTARVLDSLGVGYALPGAEGACCGALHVHAGLHADAMQLAADVMWSMPGDAPILVNSAGCGAALKDYGELLDTDDARRFSARVFDVHEWIAPRVGDLDLRRSATSFIVQDPCHLRHVQRAHLPVRTVMEAVGTVVELDDDGLCCGAGGAYSALQPELAGTRPRPEARHRSIGHGSAAAPRCWSARILAAACTCSQALADRGVNGAPSDRRARRGASMSDYASLAARLRSVAEDLDELAFDQLREAVADGATSRPAE